jgi:hypothetical protein
MTRNPRKRRLETGCPVVLLGRCENHPALRNLEALIDVPESELPALFERPSG